MGGMGGDREEKPKLIGPEIDVFVVVPLLSFVGCIKINFGFATRRLVVACCGYY
jgi:hypothetical protein